MTHSHSTQIFIPETLNRKNLSYIHYIEFHHSLYNIYNVCRYSVDTKTLIPKTKIIFSKTLKIEKSAKNSKTCPKRNLGALPRMLHVTRGAGMPHPGTPLGNHPAHTSQTKHYYEGSSSTVVESDAPTHTHAKSKTHTQHSPTCCFLCIQGSQYYIVNNPE
jgi:hypothetical protein